MKYAIFIGEVLSDSPRTRRGVWKDLHALTHLDLFTTLREAMGEPTSDLKQKCVVMWVDESIVQRPNILTDFARAFEQQRVESPFVRTFEAKGFRIGMVQKDDLIFIVAYHGGEYVSGLRELRDEWGEQVRFLKKLGRREPFTSFTSNMYDATSRLGSEGASEFESWYVGDAHSISHRGTTNDPNETEYLRIGLGAYLRSMWTLLWTAFRHPFTTTVIDLSTGKRIAELSVPFHQWEASPSNRQEEPVNG